MHGDEESQSGGVMTTEAAADGGSLEEPSGPAEPGRAEPSAAVEPGEEPSATDQTAATASGRTSRRTSVRRGLLVAGGALVVALSVSAFAMVGPTTVNADQSFVDTARSLGHIVATGDQQTLVVSAARKICDRRDGRSTAVERRASALSTDELGAVQSAFATDVRGFTTLALETYCPS